jgi:hypothetical protein
MLLDTSLTIIKTYSGSIYKIRVDEDRRFWLTTDHVVNPNSTDINGQEWEIQQPRPWPPEIGQPMWLPTIHLFDFDHPDRIPGGGKSTSIVMEVLTGVPDLVNKMLEQRSSNRQGT